MRIARVVVAAVLLVGLAYSVLGLTVAPKVAYASSCDCNEAAIDADEYCQAQYGPTSFSYNFQCPICSGGTCVALFACNNDPSQFQNYGVICD
jgi:hypothetical protein